MLSIVSACYPVLFQESDLRSALLFEQIAHAYLKFNPIGMIRKYALNMILSAHYYIKAGQVRITVVADFAFICLCLHFRKPMLFVCIGWYCRYTETMAGL